MSLLSWFQTLITTLVKHVFTYTAIGLATFFSYLCYQKFIRWLREIRLQPKIDEQKRKREDAVQQIKAGLESGTAEEKHRRSEIQKLNLSQLIEALQDDKYTALEAVQAWQEKALSAQDQTNAISLFVTEAADWATQLDAANKEPGYRKPPFFGVPFTLQESIAIAGYQQTRGYAQQIKKPAKCNSALVDAIRGLGAIPIAVTNVPQSLLSYSCSNPIYGATTHPKSKQHTSGGSSGGEAALIGSGGSLFGFGTDLEGGIRIPAHFCGIVGFKPSAERLSRKGCANSICGRAVIELAAGPMAVDVETTVIVMRQLLSTTSENQIRRSDPYMAPIPFNMPLYTSEQSLTIGFYDCDDWFQCAPACRRAVQMAKEVLENAGHKLVEWRPPRVPDAMALFTAATLVDGGHYLLSRLNRDVVDPELEEFGKFLNFPSSLMSLYLRWIDFSRLIRFKSRQPKSASDLRKIYADIERYRKEFLESWQTAELDAVICPAQVSPALPHNVANRLMGAVSYTALYNLLNYPAGVVPVTTVSKEDEEAMQEYPNEDLWDEMIRDANMHNTTGLPIAVQCVSLPFNEEIALKIMSTIEKNLV